MNSENLIEKFNQINSWKSGGQRAPHKPLLVLLALGRFQAGEEEINFNDIEPKFRKLLEDFGRPRQVIHPEYPFYRLCNDGIWELKNLTVDTTKNIGISVLRENEAIARFSPELLKQFKSDPSLIKKIANQMLDENFPETLHDDIAMGVGLNLDYSSKRKIRDPKFREAILVAYNYKCAVCGFGVRLGNSLVGLEAAHIKWHQAGGPDEVQNGMALCSLHHKLFDTGAFAVDMKHELRMLVSDQASGEKLDESLLRYHGKSLIAPIGQQYYPTEGFLSWHVNEVFKGKYRPVT